jgi:mRNA-degrading endonuclease RelE of RelBE toxin-antitoxin system
MNYSPITIIPTHRFEKELKRLIRKFPSLKNEYAQLIETLLKNPQTGTFMGNNCYKIRLSVAAKGKGKRGGARVVSHLHFNTDTIYLLTIYDKGEKQDLKPNELTEMILHLELG